jgi:uncharacterized glyoxalase superfamily protein PhnB
MNSNNISVEHIAWQVQDPPAVAAWYGQNFGFSIARKIETGPQTHFLADASKQIVVEIYNNPKAKQPDYASMDPLQLHLAFSVSDPQNECQRLIEAGATLADGLQTLANGDIVVMLRDPWGFAIQLVKRTTPLISK